jgi:hypothetical protein
MARSPSVRPRPQGLLQPVHLGREEPLAFGVLRRRANIDREMAVAVYPIKKGLWRLPVVAGRTPPISGTSRQAIDELQKAVSGAPAYGAISLGLTCAYGLAGRETEAHAAFASTNRLLPNFTIAKYKANALSDDPTYLAGRERCYGVLRKLGMPEQ